MNSADRLEIDILNNVDPFVREDIFEDNDNKSTACIRCPHGLFAERGACVANSGDRFEIGILNNADPFVREEIFYDNGNKSTGCIRWPYGCPVG